jgi:purine-binding chemotaxis protein CheW
MGPRRVLLHVDRVESVLERSCAPPPADIGFEGLRGIARLDDGLLLIHDLEAFFAPEEWHAIDRAVAGASRCA